MSAQLYLITPENTDPGAFGTLLAGLVESAPVSALLVRRNELSEADFRAMVKTACTVAQPGGCAVIVEDDAEMARECGADGVHITGSLEDARLAAKQLKPQMIVGAGPSPSRHLDMSLGELEIDYLFFGSLAEPALEDARERGGWWAETFEVPAVLHGTLDGDAAGCEFLALGSDLWRQEDPIAALRSLAERLEAA
ncbi:thiamine phosphate synthase [Devosia pacifica]|uniref:Thiamine phosphate synthase n=1 Tax=Devosia pacifica TaxID=1335967 RepID=A0A918SGT4_9HYPH|nr:thiamine phosphate synthase [Devosia pacifica]GHA38024.1 thiamine phosphate synthase [Devosia pacifica]